MFHRMAVFEKRYPFSAGARTEVIKSPDAVAVPAVAEKAELPVLFRHLPKSRMLTVPL